MPIDSVTLGDAYDPGERARTRLMSADAYTVHSKRYRADLVILLHGRSGTGGMPVAN
jgi:hypothetical protein